MSVYFIRPVGMNGPVKIGCSVHPPQRLYAMLAWSPFPLEIAATIDGDHWVERRFHARFIHLHERNEWFSWSPELGSTIEAINSGAFDISELPQVKGSPCRWGQERIAKELSDADAAVAARIHGEQ